jgi:hypothetical protein
VIIEQNEGEVVITFKTKGKIGGIDHNDSIKHQLYRMVLYYLSYMKFQFPDWKGGYDSYTEGLKPLGIALSDWYMHLCDNNLTKEEKASHKTDPKYKSPEAYFEFSLNGIKQVVENTIRNTKP